MSLEDVARRIDTYIRYPEDVRSRLSFHQVEADIKNLLAYACACNQYFDAAGGRRFEYLNIVEAARENLEKCT